MHNSYKYLFILFLLTFSLLSQANYEKDKTLDQFHSYKLVGKGTMKWLFINLYKAELRTPSGKYNAETLPIYLKLEYLRNISRKALITATESEWHRLNIDYNPEWLIQLNKIWPDVSIHDSLTLHITKQGFSEFFLNDNYIGRIENDNFSAAFSAIWLSNEARNTALRNQLIGLNR